MKKVQIYQKFIFIINSGIRIIDKTKGIPPALQRHNGLKTQYCDIPRYCHKKSRTLKANYVHVCMFFISSSQRRLWLWLVCSLNMASPRRCGTRKSVLTRRMWKLVTQMSHPGLIPKQANWPTFQASIYTCINMIKYLFHLIPSLLLKLIF